MSFAQTTHYIMQFTCGKGTSTEKKSRALLLQVQNCNKLLIVKEVTLCTNVKCKLASKLRYFQVLLNEKNSKLYKVQFLIYLSLLVMFDTNGHRFCDNHTHRWKREKEDERER